MAITLIAAENESAILSLESENEISLAVEETTIIDTGSGDIESLPVTDTLVSTDDIVVVTGDGGRRATLQTLQEYLNINTDRQILFGTTAEWNAQLTTPSKSDKLYVYTDYQTDSQGRHIAGIKVGDGNAYVPDLPFIDEVYMDHISDTTIHVTAEEKAFWNNKLNCFYGGETLTINRL